MVLPASDFSPQFPRRILDGGLQNANGGTIVPVPAGEKRTLLEVRGDDSEATCIAVQLLLALPPSLDTTLPIPADPAQRPRARIQWGAGGIAAQADCDFIGGTVINVPGSWVRVIGMDERTLAGNTAAYGMGALAAAGVIPGGVAPQFTLYHGLVAGGGGTGPQNRIADFATRLRVMRTPITSSYDVLFLDSQGTEAYRISVGAGAEMEPTPLANDVRLVQLSVPGATGITRARLIYELGF